MKTLYFLITIFGNTVGYMQLPDSVGIVQCEVTNKLQEQDWDKRWKEKDFEHDKNFVVDGRRIHRRDWHGKCMYLDAPPKLEGEVVKLDLSKLK